MQITSPTFKANAHNALRDSEFQQTINKVGSGFIGRRTAATEALPEFDELRACYKEVEDPMKGGIFGVDLRIGRGGGHPEVSQPRTSMKGQAFRDCVVGVFKAVEFEKPAKGPTVISYSVRFSAK